MSEIPDLSDRHVRDMAERHHEPDEVWSIGGQLLSVHCRTCNHSWPCPTRVAPDDHWRADRARPQEQVARAMGGAS